MICIRVPAEVCSQSPLSRSVASSHSFSSGTQNGWLSVAVTEAVCCRSQWAQAHPAPESTSPRTAINGGKGHQAVSEVVHDEQIEALADLGGEFPHPRPRHDAPLGQGITPSP
ncbi:predicted protein [Streptomyces albidoflavus]|nr:predicted protein [Streptomyces albidoflavus]